MEATLQPQQETDQLAGAVLRTLGRSHRNLFSISPSQAFWMSVVSFGVWPLWRMGRQFRGYVTFERQQLWHLAEWLRLRRGSDDALALQDQLKTIQPNKFAKLLVNACIIATLFFVFAQLNGRFSLNRVIDNTWRLHRSWFPIVNPNPIWLTWVSGLGLAYIIHTASVARHYRAIDRFVARLNRLLQQEGIAPVTMPACETDLRAGWWWSGGILTWFGAVWAIPMAFAGAKQRSYINSTSARLRVEMLERVRALLAQRRPAVAVPNFVIHSRRCGNPQCMATLRAGASFCSRCGTDADRMSEVA